MNNFLFVLQAAFDEHRRRRRRRLIVNLLLCYDSVVPTPQITSVSWIYATDILINYQMLQIMQIVFSIEMSSYSCRLQ